MDRIGDVASGLLGGMLRSDESRLGALRARWPELAGELLASRLTAADLRQGELILDSVDASWGAAAGHHLNTLVARIRRLAPELEVRRARIRGQIAASGSVGDATRSDESRRRG